MGHFNEMTTAEIIASARAEKRKPSSAAALPRPGSTVAAVPTETSMVIGDDNDEIKALGDQIATLSLAKARALAAYLQMEYDLDFRI